MSQGRRLLLIVTRSQCDILQLGMAVYLIKINSLLVSTENESRFAFDLWHSFVYLLFL